MSKIDMDYVNSLSFQDLYEMADYYDLLLYGDWSDYKNKPEFDYELCKERKKLLVLAIRAKKCSMDKKLFGSPTITNEDEFINQDSLMNDQKAL